MAQRLVTKDFPALNFRHDRNESQICTSRALAESDVGANEGDATIIDITPATYKLDEGAVDNDEDLESGRLHPKEKLFPSNMHYDCPICFEGFEVNESITWSTNLQCQHIFHTNCIKEWLENTGLNQKKFKSDVKKPYNWSCPLCRQSFVTTKTCDRQMLLL
jgi:Ring finger domain